MYVNITCEIYQHLHSSNSDTEYFNIFCVNIRGFNMKCLKRSYIMFLCIRKAIKQSIRITLRLVKKCQFQYEAAIICLKIYNNSKYVWLD